MTTHVLSDELDPPTSRHWVEFADPANDTQTIKADLTWLTSRYSCIFGQGCRGIDRNRPDAGCCVFGAHFTEPADERNVSLWVDQLTDELWAHRALGLREGWAVDAEPEPEDDDLDDEAERDGADQSWARQTRVVDGACIFCNPADFPAGGGCALHLLALQMEVPPLRAKPEVCWQLPFRRRYRHGHDVDGDATLDVIITEFGRDGWGPGGADLDWYCTTAPSAHASAQPLYLSGRDELVELIGLPAYEVLVGHCETFLARQMPLHPATATHSAAPIS